MNLLPSDPEFPIDDDVVSRIAGASRVTDYLGHWPTFHDMEVVGVSLERVPVRVVTTSDVRATFFIYDLYRSPSDPERKQALLEMLFESVMGLKISGWYHQNAITGLSLMPHPSDQDRIVVSWGGCGHDVSFDCRKISVVSLRELNPFRESLPEL